MNDMRKLIETVTQLNESEQFSTDFVGIDMDEDSVWLSTDDATIVFDKQQWDDFTNLIRGQGL